MARHWAETVAKSYLESKGYQTLAENYALRTGELDLVLVKDNVTVFVEVRQRSNTRFGAPSESLQSYKLKRIMATALHFMQTHYGRDDLAMRFDAVLLTGTQATYKLEHLENILQ
jgi:putative endonuclease